MPCRVRKLVCAAGLLGAHLLGAATNDTTLVVSVSAFGRRADDAAAVIPAKVEVLDASAIAASLARDFPELLAKTANLQVRTLNANPLQTQLAMGGFGENSFGRVKVVVDGEELNTIDMNAPDLSQIVLEGISRVEIVHGPSPVLHGDGAEAGVIRISTEPLDYSSKTHLSTKVGSYGSAGLGVRTKGGLLDDGLRYSAAYRYERADGYRHRSGYDLHNLSATLRQDFENDSIFGLKIHYSNVLYEMPGALSYSEWRTRPRQAKYLDDWCRVWDYGLSFGSKIAFTDERFLRLDGSFSVKHRTSHWGDYGYENDYDLYSVWFSPRYVDQRPLGGLANLLTLGLDARYDYYLVRDRSGFNSPEYHFTRPRGGAFAMDELSLLDSVSAVAGARFEGIGNRWTHYRGLAKSHSTDYIGDYELGFVYRPWTGVKCYLKGSRFHKSAFCDEMNYTANGEFLKPERGSSVDLGFSAEFAEEFRFDASAYFRWLEDEIFYNPHARDFGGGNWGGYNCNSSARTERRGLDLGLGWTRRQVAEASLKVSYVDAPDIPLVPAIRVRTEVGVWILSDLEVKGGFRFVSDQIPAGDFEREAEKLPSYSLFDLAINYEPSWAEGWRFGLVVDNLFDRSYCDFAGWSDFSGAYYYPAAGRTFQMSLSYSW